MSIYSWTINTAPTSMILHKNMAFDGRRLSVISVILHLKGVDRYTKLSKALRKCVRIRRRKDLNKSSSHNNGNGIIETSSSSPPPDVPDTYTAAEDDGMPSSEATSNNGTSRKWSVASVAQIHPQQLTTQQQQPCSLRGGVVRLKRHANRIRQADQTPAMDPADIQRVQVSSILMQAYFFDTFMQLSFGLLGKNCRVLENLQAILFWL